MAQDLKEVGGRQDQERTEARQRIEEQRGVLEEMAKGIRLGVNRRQALMAVGAAAAQNFIATADPVIHTSILGDSMVQFDE